MSHSQQVNILRHAETAGNRAVVYSGRSDESILPLDHEIVTTVARNLLPPSDGVIQSSPQLRALQTARAFGEELGCGILVDDRLAEMEMGSWSGLTGSEISQRYPEQWECWRSNPGSLVFEGFEGLHSVQLRSVEWLNELPVSSETVAAISHETVIRALASWVIAGDLSLYRELHVKNLCGIVLKRSRGAWTVDSSYRVPKTTPVFQVVDAKPSKFD